MKIKTVFLILSTLLFISINQAAAQNTPQTVIIRMWEIPLGAPSRMYVTDPSGNTTQIKIDSPNAKTLDTAIPNNHTTLQNEINKFKMEGFKIDGISNYSNMILIIMSKD